MLTNKLLLEDLGVIFKQFVESADVLFFAVDEEMRYIYINPFFEKVHNITLEDALGKHFREVIGEEGFQNNVKRYNRVLEGEAISYDSCFPKMNGDLHYYHATYTPIKEQGKVVGFTGVVLDTSPQKQLEILSITDQLTGIYNRRKLEEALSIEIDRSDRFGLTFGVILIDIDRFKSVNDNFSHQVGDQVLQNIASIMQERSRKIDVVGRWGGEEFLIICPESNREGLLSLAESIREKIASFDFPEIKTCTASLGVSSFENGDTSNTLVSRVDKALYVAKNKGRNRVEFL